MFPSTLLLGQGRFPENVFPGEIDSKGLGQTALGGGLCSYVDIVDGLRRVIVDLSFSNFKVLKSGGNCVGSAGADAGTPNEVAARWNIRRCRPNSRMRGKAI